MSRATIIIGALVIILGAMFVVLPDWTYPPMPSRQLAAPPASMIQFGRGQMPEPVAQAVPAPLPPAAAGGAPATATYQNVQVLTDLSAAEFMRLQQAITQWVSPHQGCAFCHVAGNDASDAKPQKQVARLMLRMVRHVNADWRSHVKDSGVTCFTCHRGQPVPAETWFPSAPPPERAIVARQENWRESGDNVRRFFPDASWDLYLLNDTPISVQSVTALPATLSIPLHRVAELSVRVHRAGTGDITLRPKPGSGLVYLKLWPHVRPWRLGAPEPMLRAIPQAGVVAPLFCRTLAAAAEARKAAQEPEPVSQPLPRGSFNVAMDVQAGD